MSPWLHITVGDLWLSCLEFDVHCTVKWPKDRSCTFTEWTHCSETSAASTPRVLHLLPRCQHQFNQDRCVGSVSKEDLQQEEVRVLPIRGETSPGGLASGLKRRAGWCSWTVDGRFQRMWRRQGEKCLRCWNDSEKTDRGHFTVWQPTRLKKSVAAGDWVRRKMSEWNLTVARNKSSCNVQFYRWK